VFGDAEDVIFVLLSANVFAAITNAVDAVVVIGVVVVDTTTAVVAGHGHFFSNVSNGMSR
jgi:hypothetical protein